MVNGRGTDLTAESVESVEGQSGRRSVGVGFGWLCCSSADVWIGSSFGVMFCTRVVVLLQFPSPGRVRWTWLHCAVFGLRAPAPPLLIADFDRSLGQSDEVPEAPRTRPLSSYLRSAQDVIHATSTSSSLPHIPSLAHAMSSHRSRLPMPVAPQHPHIHSKGDQQNK